jgi:D-alanine transaminase
VIELARKHDIEVQERDINEDELMQADEVWLTSSTREIAPVVTINKQAIGEGIAGPVWRKVLAIYQGYKQELRHA